MKTRAREMKPLWLHFTHSLVNRASERVYEIKIKKKRKEKKKEKKRRRFHFLSSNKDTSFVIGMDSDYESGHLRQSRTGHRVVVFSVAQEV